jgi:hypothetical protein
MNKVTPLKPEDARYNGGQRCDMLSGPCSCGAWHDPKMPKKTIKSDKKQSKRSINGRAE